MLRIFYHEAVGDDVESNMIAEASNRLDVGEFQFFQLSYEHWYGHQPNEDHIEAQFFAYLNHDDPPPWVRHYARHIISLDDRGSLEGRDAEYHRFDRDLVVPSPWIGWSVVLATIAAVAVFLSLIVLSDATDSTAHCMFPPCP